MPTKYRNDLESMPVHLLTYGFCRVQSLDKCCAMAELPNVAGWLGDAQSQFVEWAPSQHLLASVKTSLVEMDDMDGTAWTN